MWVALYVLVISLEHGAQELVFGMTDGLDNEAVVTRVVEERARFAWGTEFRKNVLGGQGEEVVCRIDVEVGLTKLAKDPWCVIFELEVIFC